jgi:NADH dehydrogenase (ubiquinone) 1 beta subcomplex subunit 3
MFRNMFPGFGVAVVAFAAYVVVDNIYLKAQPEPAKH